MDARPIETTQRTGLAKHRVLLELGQGGMSNVYLAVARGPGDFHKLVVLKVLRADLAQDEAFRTMALGEAKIAARLNHPNVVQTYEVLDEGERPVIVMEYLEGQSLSSVLSRTRDGTFTLAMALQVLVDALAGLHHAHELSDYDGKPFGLVHRDFTPQNIFLGYDGHVRIIDFGIAKTEQIDSDSRTGTIKGKVRYMSPEQMLGAPPIDRRADIFAAGMVLWELATRESPWKDASEIAIINHVINNELPSMRSLVPSVPDEIERICARAIQFDREDRYATAAEMAAAIEHVLATLNERVLPRDVGRVVSEHFDDVRTETKRVIEEQLAKSEQEGEMRTLLAVPMLNLRGPSGHVGTTLSPAAVPDKRRRLIRRASVAIGSVGIAVVLLLSLRHHRGGMETAAKVPSIAPSTQASSSAPTPPSAPRQVEIAVRTLPPSASIYFDDDLLPSNPAIVIRIADGSLHVVRAEAQGYQARAIEIVLDKGADLVIRLDRAAPAPGHPLSTPTGSARASSPSAKDCNPPYYVDAKGIKKFKPRCL
jgi:serine/threonine-protein kinase